MPIGVKGHALERWTGRRGSEVGRFPISTPRVTLLETISCVTGNEETGVERMIANQQLVFVSVVCSLAFPQSMCFASIPMVLSSGYLTIIARKRA